MAALERLKTRAVIGLSQPRKAPPKGLCKEETAIWQTVTKAMPHDWFSDENLELLRDYCVHVHRLHQVNAAIQTLDPMGKEYDRLARLAANESKQIVSLSRVMRLCQSSRIKPDVSGNRTAAHAVALGALNSQPWESDSLLAEPIQ